MPASLRLAAVILVALAADCARAADPWSVAEPRTSHDVVLDAVTGTAVGDTILWVTNDGLEGRGVVADIHGTRLTSTDGRTVDIRDLDRLWRRNWSRSEAVHRGATGGFLAGAVAALAMGNVYGTDGSELSSAVVAVGGLVVIGVGTLGGVLVGATSPPAATWQRVIPARSDAEPEERPAVLPPVGADLPRVPYVELGGELGSVGWSDELDRFDRFAAGVWLPVMPGLDGGLNATFGSTPDFEGSDRWDGASSFAVSGDIRILLRNQPGLQPYVGLGGGWYGELNDGYGWKVCFGLKGLSVGGTRLRLEGGTVGRFGKVGDDRPGLAYLALRLGLDLGDSSRRD